MLYLPEKCLRNSDHCKPLSQIAADGNVSFFCCGENNGESTPVKQDKYTVCFKGPHRDDMAFYDKRDITHQIAVMSNALAHIEEDDCESYYEPVKK